MNILQWVSFHHVRIKIKNTKQPKKVDLVFIEDDECLISVIRMTLNTKNKIIAVVRRSRGKDIDAACGQLANKA
jgi:adenine C2-methylase RlmN of 23S rRNA A2503 and tRNA A37